MQPANNFIVLNIREYLENEDKRLGEETLVQLLSEFSCPLNPDVERFLKEQAIDFAKKHQAVMLSIKTLSQEKKKVFPWGIRQVNGLHCIILTR